MTTLPADALVIGLGGNVEGEARVRARFEQARDALASFGPVTSAPLYRSAPIGPPQAAFLNSAIRVRVDGPAPEPRELIETLAELERLLGRDRARETHWGPRTLDLDVLVWGPRVATWVGPPALIVPHPRLAARRFALRPLADVVGFEAVLPGTDQTLAELLAALAEQELDVVVQSW